MATMLDCKKIQGELSEYVDGTLDGDRAWTIKMHVSSCAVCDQIARDFSGTARLLQGLPQAEPSLGFEAALARRLADHALAPQQRSAGLWNRLSGMVSSWNVATPPRLRPVFFAPGLAIAALVPAVFFVTAQQQKPQEFPAAVQKATTTLPNQARDTTLDDLLNDHVAYASSEPLGDPAGMLSAQNTGGGDHTL